MLRAVFQSRQVASEMEGFFVRCHSIIRIGHLLGDCPGFTLPGNDGEFKRAAVQKGENGD